MRLHVQSRMSAGLPQRRRGAPRWVHSRGCTTKPDVPVTKWMGFGGPCGKERLRPRWLGGPALSQTHSREQRVPLLGSLGPEGVMRALPVSHAWCSHVHTHSVCTAHSLGAETEAQKGAAASRAGWSSRGGDHVGSRPVAQTQEGPGGGSRVQGHPSPPCLASPDPSGPGAGLFHPA